LGSSVKLECHMDAKDDFGCGCAVLGLTQQAPKWRPFISARSVSRIPFFHARRKAQSWRI
jgi:hypothetical protein